MKRIGITMRVVITETERRDALDQAWTALFKACDFLPVLIPNQPNIAIPLCQELKLEGLLFTGGNSLLHCHGNAPERDQTETQLLEWAIQHPCPLLGICRGMQVIQHHFGVPLEPVPGQIQAHQTILIHGQKAEVNSYHEWGSYQSVEALKIWARTAEGVVKAIQHQTLPLAGIMWHPERFHPFTARDISFLKGFFR